jgi:hypothetical protein
MTIISRNRPGIDRAIQGIVKDLNDHGYRTFGSCAGHYKTHRGFITIIPEKNDIREALIKYPGLLGYYKKIGGNYGYTASYIGFNLIPVNVTHIKQLFKKHGISPVYHEPPNPSIKRGMLDGTLVHEFTFPPQMVGEG